MVKCVSAICWPYRKKKQSGRHSQLFQNHKHSLNLEILALTSSNLHKTYMASRSSSDSNFGIVSKQKGRLSHI